MMTPHKRSQPRTYSQLITKKTTVTTMNITSSIELLPELGAPEFVAYLATRLRNAYASAELAELLSFRGKDDCNLQAAQTQNLRFAR
jgi:hypothetical protein